MRAPLLVLIVVAATGCLEGSYHAEDDAIFVVDGEPPQIQRNIARGSVWRVSLRRVRRLTMNGWLAMLGMIRRTIGSDRPSTAI